MAAALLKSVTGGLARSVTNPLISSAVSCRVRKDFTRSNVECRFASLPLSSTRDRNAPLVTHLSEGISPSDVVSAGAMEWFVGTYVFETNQEAARRRSPLKAITHPQVIAELQPGGGYGISLAWHP